MTLIDQIIRNKVFNSRYWKEDCFGLTAVSLVDKATKLDSVGNIFIKSNRWHIFRYRKTNTLFMFINETFINQS
jgi:hypothetical protein